MILRLCQNCLQIKILPWPNVLFNSLDERQNCFTQRKSRLLGGCHTLGDPTGWPQMQHFKKDQIYKESHCNCALKSMPQRCFKTISCSHFRWLYECRPLEHSAIMEMRRVCCPNTAATSHVQQQSTRSVTSARNLVLILLHLNSCI